MKDLEARTEIERDWVPALLRGWAGRCPSCGERTLFTSYLKMTPVCRACGSDFERYRAGALRGPLGIFLGVFAGVLLAELLSTKVSPTAAWLIGGAVIGVLWALRVRSRPVL